MSFHDRKRYIPDNNLDSWLLTYADMITLFVCFFALLLALSAAKMGTLEKVKKDIAEQFTGNGIFKIVDHHQQVIQEFQNLMYANQFQKNLFIQNNENEVILDFKSASLFDSGSADIKEQGQVFLQQLAGTIQHMVNEGFTIEIQGHTDDIPISTERFPSNWELSTGRATTVVRFLIAQGIDEKKFKAVGYADALPKVPNRTAEGVPIPENQAANRRIIIKLIRKEAINPALF